MTRSASWRPRPLLYAMLAAGAALGVSCGRTAPPPGETTTANPSLTDSEIRDRDIEFYRQRVERDSTGGADLARLAALYLLRSRETGNSRDAEQAESLARRSMVNRRAHNDAASQVLASSLLAQHEFSEALCVARDLRTDNPTSAPLRALVAEIEMELGMYDSARVTFDSLTRERSSLAVVPRLARWAEIQGRPDEARYLIRHSIALSKHDARAPREQLAWLWLRLGDIELRAGKFNAAASAYQRGLDVRPGDHRLLAGRARVAVSPRRWEDAIRDANQAVTETLDPATLGILSDAHAALGDTARASEYSRALDVAVRSEPGAYHRAWSLFLLDHGRQLTTVHQKIRDELRTRRDVYGYDLYAWSLYRQGRFAEARRQMALALQQGTKDAQLFYHASKIEEANGANESARAYLDQARALNPSLR